MTSQARRHISAFFARRRAAMAGMAVLLALAASACAVQESNTYPIELFTEMQYSQAQRAQEPPRLQPPASSVVYAGTGDPAASLEVPATQRGAYDQARAAQLYSVNCAVCHGVNGLGDGPAAAHLTSDRSFFANRVENGTQHTGAPYARPPDLQNTRQNREEQTVFGIINNGVVVMPRFGEFLTEEEIWQIVSYIYDTQGGLGTAR